MWAVVRDFLYVGPHDLSAEIDRIYRSQSGALRLYFRSVTRNDEDAEDLLQETFIRLLRLSRSRRLHSLDVFIWRLAHFLLKNTVRNSATRERRETPWADWMESRPAPVTDRDMILSVRDALRRVLTLPELHPLDREIFALRYLGLQSFREIANCTGTTVSETQNRLRRAQAAARVEFRRYGLTEALL
jgi:RNA polymerase sigma-70 factor (ECF subfamily)